MIFQRDTLLATIAFRGGLAKRSDLYMLQEEMNNRGERHLISSGFLIRAKIGGRVIFHITEKGVEHLMGLGFVIKHPKLRAVVRGILKDKRRSA